MLVAAGTLTAVAAAIPDFFTDMLIPALAIGPLHHLRPADDQPLDLPRGDQLRLRLRGGHAIGREDFLVHAVGLPSMMLRYRGRLGRLLPAKFPQEGAAEDHLVLLVDVHQRLMHDHLVLLGRDISLALWGRLLTCLVAGRSWRNSRF
jgi:hypothetical protein